MANKRITSDGEIIHDDKWHPIPQTTPFWKTPFNHDTDMESKHSALTCTDPSKTQQQFKDDADINNILRKFMEGGDLPLTGPARYMDVEKEFDLQNEMVTGWEVQEAWNKLSPEVRNTLKDPLTFANYVTHCLETGDLEPLEKMGLATPPKTPEPPTPPTGGTPAPDGGKGPP